ENPSPALLHVVVASLQNNFNIPAEISFIVILTVINVAAILMIRAALKKECYDNTSLQQYRIDAVSVAMLLVSAIVIPFISENWYFIKFSPNPLHNSTYLSCRFFAIPVFFLLFKSYDTYKLNKIKSVKYYVMMAFFATLCMLSKPSFLMAFLPACCWVMFIDLFLTKFKSFWPSF
ncbi:MAG: hypothetical protein IJW74_07205, partial [Oscillospiraceae bacterium]|nr:hypothetical protein [Oscillospiraceae bacterium]